MVLGWPRCSNELGECDLGMWTRLLCGRRRPSSMITVLTRFTRKRNDLKLAWPQALRRGFMRSNRDPKSEVNDKKDRQMKLVSPAYGVMRL